MPLPRKPDRTKWSETDSYLHALLRDLRTRLDLLEEYVESWSEDEELPEPGLSPDGYTFVFAPEASTKLFCSGTMHVFTGRAEMCGCGFVPRPE